MNFKVFELTSMGANCYVLWDEETNIAMLIDPGEEDARIDKFIEKNGLKPIYIALTHTDSIYQELEALLRNRQKNLRDFQLETSRRFSSLYHMRTTLSRTLRFRCCLLPCKPVVHQILHQMILLSRQ